MLSELQKILPTTRIRSQYIDLLAFASDAGFYKLIPKAIVQPTNEAEIQALFTFSHKQNIPMVFRTAGTSLSGQAITDGILVDLSQFWNKISVENEGETARVQPGITGAMVNVHLKKHQRKIGPDPASINSAMMGGILSNNASGMCCGVQQNSYHTTKHIRFVLPNGKIFSTETPADYLRFEQECADIAQVLVENRQKILSNDALFNKIRKKYKTKTTIGYSMNAFLDYERPLDIFAHLLIGAEGTLAFISEAVLETVPDYPHKSTALLYFQDIYIACQAIVSLSEAGAMTVELMDRASLTAVQEMEGIPQIVKTLPETAAALLVEFQEESQEKLNEKVQAFLNSCSDLSFLNTPTFTNNATEQALLWKIRKGLFPAVGAVRKSGTTVILEDVAFPVEKLGDAIADLQTLFRKYDYTNAIIFGHAKDGNIHFVVTQSFNTNEDIERYDRFMREVIAVVINKYDGTLKGEHGTGRNMAPFVETEWGKEAYEIMRALKTITDPHNLLNPDVIINPDAQAHLKNLKKLPSVEEEIDKCTECGFCEHVCPSRDLTTTPRRRIVLRRSLKTLQEAGEMDKYHELLEQYEYKASETCAVDGLCATACPVDINTGDLTKRLRRESHSTTANKIALWLAKNFALIETITRLALNIGVGFNQFFGRNTMLNLTKTIRRLVPTFPLWSNHFQKPPSNLIFKKTKTKFPHIGGTEGGLLYFPACISRLMGTYEGKDKNLMETFVSVCQKVNIDVKTLSNLSGSCCGQIFSSKGFSDAYRFTAEDIVQRLWQSSDSGKIPIVIDVSSCAYTFQQIRPVLSQESKMKFDSLKILDSVDFLHDFVLPLVPDIQKANKNIVLHPVCSLKKMKTEEKFVKIAQHFAQNVNVPKSAGCCGMAGDRGFLFPELTASATQAETKEVQKTQYDGYYSSTKTCEIALSEAVNQNYESIVYLVEEAL